MGCESILPKKACHPAIILPHAYFFFNFPLIFKSPTLKKNNMDQQSIQSLQMNISIIFFTLTVSLLSFSLLLFLQNKLKPWCCNCHVCKSYLNSSWKSSFNNLSDWYTHLLSNSPTQTIQLHVLRTTITSNFNNVEYMLSTNFNNFPKGKAFSSILGDLLGKGIFNVDGDLWRFQRKMASLELGSVSVRSYAFSITINEISSRLFPVLSSLADSGDVVDIQDVFRRFSFDTICRISFGLDPGCLDLSMPLSEFAAAFDLASSLSARRALSVAPAVWKLKKFLNLGSEKDLRKAIRLVNTLADEVIRQRRKVRLSSNSDLLSRFMGSIDNDKYLRDIVISFLLAGRDTVASGLTTLVLLLSDHPQVLAKMRQEIYAVTEDRKHLKENMISYDELRSMSYVHAALHESLRLFPPVQFDSKFCVEDDILPDGTFVNKDSRVTYHPYAMGRMENIWGEDWAKFRPERWLNESGSFVPVGPFRYPVFQGGARVCLGKEMALMEMKAVIVSIVREFDVETVGGDHRSPRFAAGLTASLSGGLKVRVRRRSAC